ncbi:hypothetical protein [Bradyrhizobium sp. RD5-C2]|uniref:hypothetical protein n=1 Tax=Bradyrhizobium sp. RD5-C2 TaxID=244562 RepID=UPI001CC5B1E4|nr:hypothetical protein [Bradyrhizobium sp. RD5-C2]GIQ73345.1 hypothetical protein BraRD5C2_17830 [Bradyrhizobium sp. RD5-C2]
MDVKDAVNTAKNWVQEILADEDVQNVGLEEVEYNDEDHVWDVTIGFSRRWNTPKDSQLTGLAAALAVTQPALKRAYRVISISDLDGKVVSMKRRVGDST